MVFIIIINITAIIVLFSSILISFHWMSFIMTRVHVCVALILFVYHFLEAGARGWVVDTAGHRGRSIWQGLFWPPDLHLPQRFSNNGKKSILGLKEIFANKFSEPK